jgi:hypothetical protein
MVCGVLTPLSTQTKETEFIAVTAYQNEKVSSKLCYIYTMYKEHKS